MSFIIFGRPKQVSDLKDHTINHSAGSLRSQIPILVVDDQEFPYLEVLRQHGFNLTFFNDISDVRQVNNFPVVVCDIKGVGKSFKSKYEGAHVIAEIKKYFPTKILIAFTAHMFDSSFNKYFAM